MLFIFGSDLCEPGWVVGYNYGCYKIVTDLVTWDEARSDCASITDGDLVVMETEEEFNFLRDLLVEGDYWIGRNSHRSTCIFFVLGVKFNVDSCMLLNMLIKSNCLIVEIIWTSNFIDCLC